MLKLGLASACFLCCFIAFSATEVATVYYDLSHVVKENITKWPSTKALTRTVNKGTKPNGIWYQTESVNMGTHLGTHLDAPCHFAQGFWCVDDIPFERLAAVPLAIVDIRYKVFSGDNVVDRDAEVLPKDLLKWEERNGKFPDGVLVMFRTGFGRFFNDTNMYRGTDSEDPASHSFPGVSTPAAEWLVKFRKVYGVGIDGLSIDYGKGDGQTHEVFGKHNVYILENVNVNVEKLPEWGAVLNVGVLKLGGQASGAPARLIAAVPPSLQQVRGQVRNSASSLVLSGMFYMIIRFGFIFV